MRNLYFQILFSGSERERDRGEVVSDFDLDRGKFAFRQRFLL